MSHSALIGFDVAHIAGVAHWRFGSSVLGAGRIEMAARGRSSFELQSPNSWTWKTMLAWSKAFNVRRDFTLEPVWVKVTTPRTLLPSVG